MVSVAVVRWDVNLWNSFVDLNVSELNLNNCWLETDILSVLFGRQQGIWSVKYNILLQRLQ